MSHWVYILTNERNTTLSVGITNDPRRQFAEHKLREPDADKYHVNKLIYLEETKDTKSAIIREWQLNELARLKKEILINKENPGWDEIVLNPL